MTKNLFMEKDLQVLWATLSTSTWTSVLAKSISNGNKVLRFRRLPQVGALGLG